MGARRVRIVAGLVMLELAACGARTIAEPAAAVAPPVAPAPRVAARASPFAIGERVYVREPAELRLDGPGGPVVGTAHVGATLEVIAVHGALAAFELTSFDHARSGEPLVVLVPVDALIRVPVAAELPAIAGRIVDGFERELAPTPGADAFTTTVCGAATVIEEQEVDGQVLQRIAQLRDGIELFGWVDRPIRERRGGLRCPQRATWAYDDPTATPPGDQVRVDGNAVARDLPRALRRGAVLFFLVDESEGAVCRRMQVGRDELRSEWYVEGAAERHADALQATYGISRRGPVLHLTGPTITERVDGPVWRSVRARCMQAREVVAVHDDRIELLYGDGRAIAYHPDDAEVWFRARDACEAAASIRNATPIDSDPGSVASLPAAWSGC